MINKAKASNIHFLLPCVTGLALKKMRQGVVVYLRLAWVFILGRLILFYLKRSLASFILSISHPLCTKLLFAHIFNRQCRHLSLSLPRSPKNRKKTLENLWWSLWKGCAMRLFSLVRWRASGVFVCMYKIAHGFLELGFVAGNNQGVIGYTMAVPIPWNFPLIPLAILSPELVAPERIISQFHSCNILGRL